MGYYFCNAVNVKANFSFFKKDGIAMTWPLQAVKIYEASLQTSTTLLPNSA